MNALRPRPPRRRRAPRLLRWLVALVLAAAIFAVGIAVGEALHDNPVPGKTSTSLRTIHP